VVKLLHIFLGGITILVLGWLFWLNLVPGGDVTYVQDFKHRNPFISDLWPPEALQPVEKNGRPFIKDEVTFFIRPPREFERAQLQMYMEHSDKLKPELLIQTEPGKEAWQAISWQSILPDSGGALRVYQATFVLDSQWRNPQKRYTMKVRVPGLQKTGTAAKMQKMSVRFVSPRVTLGDFWELLRR